MKRALLELLVAAMAISPVAWAQDQEPDEGPGPAVARLSVIGGDVSVRRGEAGDLTAAALNAPLQAGDRLVTGAGSRAEIQLDRANMLRVAASTEVRLAQMDNQRYQVQVARGMVTFRVLRASEAQTEIDTPSIGVHPVGLGSYRITVREDGTSEITVRSGQAEILGPRGSEKLSAGQTMMVRGPSEDPEFQVVAANARDEWDAWNENRDRQLEGSRSYAYVSPEISGAEDLDDYGQWQNVPDYGYCWYPRVAVGWAPYRYGRWVWEDWYGWTWLSYDPWGWAPFHYGRWFWNAGFGWGWWPGHGYRHHYWSPGLVGFVGWNHWGGFYSGRGFGGIGWVPLAPHERYYRWYGRNRGGDIHGGFPQHNGIHIGNTFRNARVANAITGVDRHGFVSGRAGMAIHMNNAELGRASLVRGSLPASPGRDSRRFSDRAVQANSFAQSRGNQRFFNQQSVGRADRGSFQTQRGGSNWQSRSTIGGQRSQVGGNSWRGFGSSSGYSAPRTTEGNRSYSGRSNGYSRPGYGGGTYSRPAPSNSGRSYNSPSYSGRTYSPPSYSGRSYSAPNYSGRSYSAPSFSGRTYSAPSDRGRSYSAPAPSYRGGGGGYSRPAPSYHGGGGGGSSHSAPSSGGRSYSGGGHSGGGGSHGGHGGRSR